MGPAPRPKVLDRAGLSLKDIDLIEVNEAFAAQMSPWKKSSADRDRVNVNGGAIAWGSRGRTGTRCCHVDAGVAPARTQARTRHGLLGGGQGLRRRS